MAGTITVDVLSDGTKRYRARYRAMPGATAREAMQAQGRSSALARRATSAIVTRTWTAPERGRVTVEAWAEQWLAAQTGLKPSTLYRYQSLLRAQILSR